MRTYDGSKIDAQARRYFGGGGGGGGDTRAMQQQNDMMQRQFDQAAQQAAASQAAAMAQAAAQQKAMEQQLKIMEQQRLDALNSQKEQLEILKSQQVTPDPAATADTSQNTYDTDQKVAAAKRQGLRKSILAGDKDAPLLTGPSTLG